MKVAVVILNWNGKDWLNQFLPNVIEHSQEAEIWIIDNASTDGSVEFIKTNFPTVKLLVNTKNQGYAGGYNFGLFQIEADIFVLLNSDIEVAPNWISPIIQRFQEDEKLAACQPVIMDFYNKSQFEYAGAHGGFMDKDGFMFCAGRMFNHLEENTGQYDTIQEVFWASGAAMFVRAEVFKNSGGLDEDFFAHMEEIDLCWRMKNQGYKIGVCSESTVYHVGGGTLSKISPFKTYLNFRNNLYLIIKNEHRRSWVILFLKRLLMDGLAGVHMLARGYFKHIFSIIKAHLHVYRDINMLLKKRKENTPTEKPNYNGIYDGGIVSAHFLLGVKKFSDLPQDKFLK